MIERAQPKPSGTQAKPAADPAQVRNDDALVKAAQAFEAVFLRQMIGSMRQASLGEDVLGSSAANQFRDMADGRLADQMAAGKGFGIANLLVKQLARAGKSR